MLVVITSDDHLEPCPSRLWIHRAHRQSTSIDLIARRQPRVRRWSAQRPCQRGAPRDMTSSTAQFGSQTGPDGLREETALPSGKTEDETTQGRADVGDVTTAETLGTLARNVLSSSRHAASRELARAVLQLLAGLRNQS
jgi:hypothetical protein